VPLLDQHLFALGFSGVSGQHQAHADLLQQRAHLSGAEARRAQGADGVADGFAQHSVRLALAQHTDALLIFGGIDQLEVVAEGSDQDALAGQVLLADVRQQFVGSARLVGAARFGRGAHGLHRVEGVVAVLFADDHAQQAAEQPDVRAERVHSLS